MRAMRLTVPAAVAVLLSCSSPFEGCACSPMYGHAVLHGTVTDATQQPVSGALVQALLYHRVCGEGPSEAHPGQDPLRTGADGAFRVQMISTSHGISCVDVMARDSAGGNPTRVTAAVIFLTGSEPPDSVRVDIQLPPTTSSFSRR